jgi:hypothetical protein
MFFQNKNIILYTHIGGVAGFVEIKIDDGRTNFRIKQDIERNLFLSLVINGDAQVININEFVTNFSLDREIDLESEIFACLVRRTGEKVETVATGAINLNKVKPQDPPIESRAVAEIDSAFKKICSVDGEGNHLCEKCPYREYFFTPQSIENNQKQGEVS